jgi:protocatechuate 3,4-dioxygenase beta subunit
LLVRRRLARIFAAGRSVSKEVHDLYLETTAAMTIRRPPRLLVTDALESPALVGLRRTTILIPQWLADKPDHAALAWALRHELTHWQHGDLWLIRLREIVRTVFYFHPAAWWAGKLLELALETACDRAVICNESEAADYAKRLYEILDAVRNRRQQPLAGGLFATRSQIARRLRMLVESPLRLRAKLTRTAVLGVSLLAGIVFAVGSGLRHDVNAQDVASQSSDTVKTDEVNASRAAESKKNDGSPEKEPVAGGVNVVGKVVDESGKPVAGVSIRLYAPVPDAATTKSDAEGSFSILMRQERPGTLVATDDEGKWIGYAPCYPVLDERVAPRITLKSAREVTIKVVDAHGAPVAGATWASPGAQWDLDNFLFNGKTAEDGTARMRFSYDARPYQVIAFKSGVGFDYLVTTRQPNQDFHEQLSGEITLVLSGAKTLTIKAEGQNGQPVEGVTFSLGSFKKPEAKEQVFLSRCHAVQVTTDASGKAVFDWLPESFSDTVRFACVSSDYVVREAPGRFDLLWVQHGDLVKELVVPLLRRTAISGKVFDSDGKPLAGIAIEASGFGRGRTGRGQARTDAGGRYQMNVESQQAYVVGVVDDRWAAPDQVGVVVLENQPAENIDFDLDEGTLVRGTVIDQTGRPVTNYPLVLSLETDPLPKEIAEAAGLRAGISRLRFFRRSQSDGNGRFQFRVGRGNYTLVATQTGGYSSQTPQSYLTIDDEREIVRDLKVQIDQTALLRGKLLDPDGKPVANQRISGSYEQRQINEETSFSARTGADGTFQVQRKALPAILRAWTDDWKLGALTAINADQIEVTLQLQTLFEAHGRFLDEKGAGAPRQEIMSGLEFPLEGGGARRTWPLRASTDTNGRFKLVGLFPGEHTISLFDAGHVQHLTKITIKGPGPLDLGDLRVPPIPDQQALTLKGKAVDADGKPVAGVEVRARFLQSSSRGRARNTQAKTTAEGAFEIKRPAVPAILSVDTPNNKLGGLARVDEKQGEVELRILPLGKARGILTDSSGKAVPGAFIRGSIVGITMGVLAASATTADDGSYTLEGLLPGEEYRVRYIVYQDGGNGTRYEIRGVELATIKLEKAETVDLGKIALPP